MPFVTLDGVVVHYEARPAAAGAPTILFSNSLGTDFRIWDPIVARLPDSFGLVRYDKRGHGLTDLAKADTLDAHVGDAVGLLDHLGLGKVVVCGLSVGGLIAQGFAAAHPDRLAALILCCTGAKVGAPADWNARIKAVEEGGIVSLAGPIMERWFSPAFHRAEPAILAGMTNMLVRQPDDGYAAVCRMLRDTDLREAAGRVSVPTLAIAGSEDKATPPDLVRGTADLIPGARFRLIEGAGHIPCVEAPDALAGHLLEFLKDNGFCDV
ncbi:3-oxoadipate enol-lactonase [Acuticoccus kandeliae]|uniref:3-oxoadipate enol-lactonase n=1 Tax=Acuticoccus kandeliae TaxID=2073160 RepID=UPI000D3E9843|nr:3-oxoadipate enol-lactonase [Acuticoccus kandeliae]